MQLREREREKEFQKLERLSAEQKKKRCLKKRKIIDVTALNKSVKDWIYFRRTLSSSEYKYGSILIANKKLVWRT